MTMTDPIAAPGGEFNGGSSAEQNANVSDQQAITDAVALYNSNSSLQQYVANNYGDDAWMLSNPELLGVISAAAVNGWDQARVDGALEQTNWWKQNGQAIRQWQQLQATDPASAQQQVAQAKNSVLDEANNLGVAMTDDQLTNMATMSQMYQWNSDTLKQAIASQYQSTATPTSGTAASFADQAQQLVGEYMVPVSKQAIQQWTANAVKGTADQNGFEDYLRGQAANLYPFMDKALEQGMTPKDWFSPYTSVAQSTLGISADQVDWTNPKWTNALTQMNPDGTRTPVNTTDFTRTLMSDPSFGYQNTQNAQDAAYSMANTILTTFGKVKA